MTIHEANQQLLFQLFNLYDEREAKNIADWAMENISGWKKIDRVMNKTVPLSNSQQQLLKQYIKEIQTNKPIQYILHEAWFYKMKLYVNEHVLIPRPETEELVQWIIEDEKNKAPNIEKKILDIGTGSGCIPLALKKNIPFFDVHSCDISEQALVVAKKNAVELNINVQFHVLNFLSQTENKNLPLFDIIVSNPPYIPQSDKIFMEPHVVNHEPHLALFVDNNNPLIFYTAIANFSTTHLKKNGSIYVEIHEDLASKVIELFKNKGFKTIELKKDAQNKERMIKIK